MYHWSHYLTKAEGVSLIRCDWYSNYEAGNTQEIALMPQSHYLTKAEGVSLIRCDWYSNYKLATLKRLFFFSNASESLSDES